MPELTEISREAPHYVPLLVTLATVAVVLGLIHWSFEGWRRKMGIHSSFGRPIVMLIATVVGLIAVIIALPIHDSVKDQLLGLFGLVLTGIIGLSSTTFVSNAMAGLMLRSIRSFRTGDFIRVGDNFGRVSDRGLFHTEIQTEDRDLTTLPNLYLVTNAVTVVRTSGTIVSATVSLGYDVSQSEIEPLLLAAARSTGLQEPFVRVLELGDFSVNYRVSGMLSEVKQLVSKRSQLRIGVLNTLHAAGIEILSPSAMMQRPLAPGQQVMPTRSPTSRKPTPAKDTVPEDRIFDKADEAEELERLDLERDRIEKELSQLRKKLGEMPEEERSPVENSIQSAERNLQRLEARREALGAEEKG